MNQQINAIHNELLQALYTSPNIKNSNIIKKFINIIVKRSNFYDFEFINNSCYSLLESIKTYDADIITNATDDINAIMLQIPDVFTIIIRVSNCIHQLIKNVTYNKYKNEINILIIKLRSFIISEYEYIPYNISLLLKFKINNCESLIDTIIHEKQIIYIKNKINNLIYTSIKHETPIR